MTGFPIHLKDATGLRKTISRTHPVPVEIRGMDDLVAVNDSVHDAAGQNGVYLDRLGSRNVAALFETCRALSVEIWWASWASCGQIEMTRKAIVRCVIGLGIVQVGLFILDKVI
jgi:hypothetical protein